MKNDRRWFVPGITEVKRDKEYWVDLYAWLVEGGLEIVHEWADWPPLSGPGGMLV